MNKTDLINQIKLNDRLHKLFKMANVTLKSAILFRSYKKVKRFVVNITEMLGEKCNFNMEVKYDTAKEEYTLSYSYSGSFGKKSSVYTAKYSTMKSFVRRMEFILNPILSY